MNNKSRWKENVMEEKMKTGKEEIPMLIMKKTIGITKEQCRIWKDFVQEMIISYPRLLLPVINEFFDSNYSQRANVTVAEKYSIKIEEKVYVIKIEFGEEKYENHNDENCISNRKKNAVKVLIEEKKRKADKINKAVILYVDYMLFKVEDKNIYHQIYDLVSIKRIQDFSLAEIKEKQLYFFCFMIPVRVYSEMNPYFWSIDAGIFANSLKECISMLKEAVKNGFLSDKEENLIATKFEAVCMKIFGQDSIIKKKWE